MKTSEDLQCILNGLPVMMSNKGTISKFWTYARQNIKLNADVCEPQASQNGKSSFLLHFSKNLKDENILQMLTDPQKNSEEALCHLEDLCLPFILLLFQRFLFHCSFQQNNETIEDYVKELDVLSKSCEFDSNGFLRVQKVRDQFDWGAKTKSNIQLVQTRQRIHLKHSTHEDSSNIVEKKGTKKSGEILVQNVEKEKRVDCMEGNNESNVDDEEDVDLSMQNHNSPVRESELAELWQISTTDKTKAKPTTTTKNQPVEKELPRRTSRQRKDSEKGKDKLHCVLIPSISSSLEKKPRKRKADGNKNEPIYATNVEFPRKMNTIPVNTIKKKPRKDSLVCSICSETFLTARQLKVHRKTHQFICSDCPMEFNSMWSLNRHVHSVHSFCKICDKKVECLSKHNIMHQDKHHTCHLCGKSFPTGVRLREHLDTHNPNREVKGNCDFCGRTFLTLHSLRRHRKVHTKPVICELCGKSWTDKSALKVHMLFHNGEKKFSCDTCNKGFVLRHLLMKHIREKHTQHLEEKPHQCETCGKGYRYKALLKAHIMIHTGEKPHKCDNCSAAFVRKSHLRRHEASHLRKQALFNHFCDICDKGFLFERELVKHKKIFHNPDLPDKPHVCSVCGKGFKVKSYLTNHMIWHSGRRVHKCDECGKSFVFKHHLRRHQALHLKKPLIKQEKKETSQEMEGQSEPVDYTTSQEIIIFSQLKKDP